jgi:hypothetical protein
MPHPIHPRAQRLTDQMGHLAMKYQKAGLGFIRDNGKTGVSFDVDSKCTHRCNYCYTSHRAEFLKPLPRFYSPKRQWNPAHKLLLNGFLREFRELFPEQFVRIFAHSDWKPKDNFFWRNILRACQALGVPTVTFTKTRRAVTQLAPLTDRVMISTDNAARWGFTSPSWVHNRRLIDGYRRKHPNVRVFAMVIDEEDIRQLTKTLNPDIFVSHHGWRSHLAIGKPLGPERVRQAVGAAKACCATGRCCNCPNQCTLTRQLAELA